MRNVIVYSEHVAIGYHIYQTTYSQFAQFRMEFVLLLSFISQTNKVINNYLYQKSIRPLGQSFQATNW